MVNTKEMLKAKEIKETLNANETLKAKEIKKCKGDGNGDGHKILVTKF